MRSGAGTGIAAVQGLSGLTKGDSVFIQKQERITKSFLSSTVAVNGLCTCSSSFLHSSGCDLSNSPRMALCSAHRLSALDAPRHFARCAPGLRFYEGGGDHGRVWRALLDHRHSHHRHLHVQIEQLQRLPRHGEFTLPSHSVD